MTELKTLKDLVFSESPEEKYHGVDKQINEMVRNILKQEAIKWVKALERTPMDYEDDGANGEVKGKIEFIEEFFNLTSEDLK